MKEHKQKYTEDEEEKCIEDKDASLPQQYLAVNEEETFVDNQISAIRPFGLSIEK